MKNDIKKILVLGAVILASVFALNSCADINLTPDGRKVVQWQALQLDGSYVTARATYFADGAYSLSYLRNGVFLSYTPGAKNPIHIGEPPSSANSAAPSEPVVVDPEK